MCATEVDDNWYGKDFAECGPDCPLHPNGFTSDDTLKVAHDDMDLKEMKICLKLLAIMGFSLILNGLMVAGLGMFFLRYTKYLSFLFSQDDLEHIGVL